MLLLALYWSCLETHRMASNLAVTLSADSLEDPKGSSPKLWILRSILRPQPWICCLDPPRGLGPTYWASAPQCGAQKPSTSAGCRPGPDQQRLCPEDPGLVLAYADTFSYLACRPSPGLSIIVCLSILAVLSDLEAAKDGCSAFGGGSACILNDLGFSETACGTVQKCLLQPVGRRALVVEKVCPWAKTLVRDLPGASQFLRHV